MAITSSKRSLASPRVTAASAATPVAHRAVASCRVSWGVKLTAADRWRAALEAWAIPEVIAASASQSPWIHPPALFDVPQSIEPSPSHDLAREAVPSGGTVLDVGCGGGIAAFALAPPAARVIGVDHQVEMLTMFRANAVDRGLSVETIEGFWPAVADRAPVADVAVAHHVAYNVADVVPFLAALGAHARHRVVLELPNRHPLASLDGAWRHFWNLERPDGPTPEDLLAVLDEMGIAAHSTSFVGRLRAETDLDQAAHFTRIRLCLPAERESEVRDFLVAHPPSTTRALTTIWWPAGPGQSD